MTSVTVTASPPREPVSTDAERPSVLFLRPLLVLLITVGILNEARTYWDRLTADAPLRYREGTKCHPRSGF